MTALPDFPPTQPIKQVLAARRITLTALARACHRNRHALGRVVNGWDPAPTVLRRELAELLGVDETVLFRAPRTPGVRYPGDLDLGRSGAGQAAGRRTPGFGEPGS